MNNFKHRSKRALSQQSSPYSSISSLEDLNTSDAYETCNQDDPASSNSTSESPNLTSAVTTSSQQHSSASPDEIAQLHQIIEELEDQLETQDELAKELEDKLKVQETVVAMCFEQEVDARARIIQLEAQDHAQKARINQLEMQDYAQKALIAELQHKLERASQVSEESGLEEAQSAPPAQNQRRETREVEYIQKAAEEVFTELRQKLEKAESCPRKTGAETKSPPTHSQNRGRGNARGSENVEPQPLALPALKSTKVQLKELSQLKEQNQSRGREAAGKTLHIVRKEAVERNSPSLPNRPQPPQLHHNSTVSLNLNLHQSQNLQRYSRCSTVTAHSLTPPSRITHNSLSSSNLSSVSTIGSRSDFGMDPKIFLSTLPPPNSENKLHLLIAAKSRSGQFNNSPYWRENPSQAEDADCCSSSFFLANLDNFLSLLCNGNGAAFYHSGVEVFKTQNEKDFSIPVEFFDKLIQNVFETSTPEKMINFFHVNFFHGFNKPMQFNQQELPAIWWQFKELQKIKELDGFSNLERLLINKNNPESKFMLRIHAHEDKMTLFKIQKYVSL